MDANNAEVADRPPKPFLLPPPLYFVLAFAIGMLLHLAVPFGFGDFPGRVPLGLTILGIGVLGGGLMGATFLFRRTTLNPFAVPSSLVRGGPYRVSRNPMYLLLVTAYIGGCLLASSWWPIPLLLVPIGILDRVVIPFEESLLSQRFGAVYDTYAARVRRWL